MKSQTKRKINTSFVLTLFSLSFLGASCFGPKAPLEAPITLTYWRPFEEKSTFDPIIAAYKAIKPNVTIEYKKLKPSEYEDELINAFSLDRGPDIFAIHDYWLPKYQERLAPVPAEIMTAKQFETDFAEVATVDFVSGGQPYAMPLSIDTLALYYNKDHFNQANIPSPPKTWKEFSDDLKLLTKTDDLDNIVRAGAAIGTAKNVNRSMDILSLLMLQNGTEMTDAAHTEATFDQTAQSTNNQAVNPGQNALEFYTNFASPRKADIYTWNPKLDYSIDAFAEGNASMMFNYSFNIKTIKAKVPDLNFGVAPMPQLSDSSTEIGAKVNLGNYWGEAVSAKSAHQKESWEFIKFLSSKEILTQYLNTTGGPTSRRDMVNEQLEDSTIGAFASQVLTAKSWYKPDATAVDNIFVQMIDSVNLGSATIQEAIKTAAQQTNQLFETNN